MVRRASHPERNGGGADDRESQSAARGIGRQPEPGELRGDETGYGAEQRQDGRAQQPLVGQGDPSQQESEQVRRGASQQHADSGRAAAPQAHDVEVEAHVGRVTPASGTSAEFRTRPCVHDGVMLGVWWQCQGLRSPEAAATSWRASSRRKSPLQVASSRSMSQSSTVSNNSRSLQAAWAQ